MPLNQQQSGSFATRRIVFVVLLIVSLVLATLYGREAQDGPLHAAQASVRGITGQVGSVGAGIGSAAEAAGDAVQDATANPTTLSGLREQNEELRSLLAEAEEYRQEVERLSQLLEMKQAAGVTGPTAHVIGRSVNAWDQSITIDLGSADGVQGGMTIMGASGVIGQVSHAGEHSSTVRLLSDPNSGAAVMVQSSRANGIVRGSINGLLYLEDLDEDVIPEVGDVVVTSGLGGSYEAGLLVGTIISVNKTETDSTGDIVVSPNGDASMFEEVIVVFTAPEVASGKSGDSASKSAASASADEGQESAQDESLDEDGESEETDGEAVEEGEEAYAEDEEGLGEEEVAEEEVAEEDYVDEGALDTGDEAVEA